MIGEAIHQAHYNNQAFTGNCFTCTRPPMMGELVLFDEYIYTGELGGFLRTSVVPNGRNGLPCAEMCRGGDTMRASTWSMIGSLTKLS